STLGLLIPCNPMDSKYCLWHSLNNVSIASVELLIIRTVQSSVYFLDSVKEIMEKINKHSLSEIRKITIDSLAYMDYQIEQQLRGAHYLYKLIELIKQKGNGA